MNLNTVVFVVVSALTTFVAVAKPTLSGIVINGIGFGTASAKVGKTPYTWTVGVE